MISPAAKPIAASTNTSTQPPVVASSKPPFQISVVGVDRARWLKAVFYGAQGTGKTELACSSIDVPSMGDVILIDAEGGDLTLQDNPRIKNWEQIKRIPVTNFMTVGRIQEYLKAHCIHRDSNNVAKLRQNQAFLSGVPESSIADEAIWRFRTVIIDSLTEVEMYNMYALMGVEEGKLLEGARDEIEVAGWDEFRKNNMMVQILVRAFRDLPMHVIFICHQRYSQDELKRYHYSLSLTGQLQNQVQGLVDLVGFLQVAPQPDDQGRLPRRLNIQPTGRYSAKSRRANFASAYIDDPSMHSILKAVGLLGA